MVSEYEIQPETLACTRHPSCLNEQDRVAALYETLSGYDASELDDEQNAFVRAVEELQDA